MEEFVTLDLCEIKHRHLQDKADEIKRIAEKRLDAHAAQLDRLELAIVQNSTTLERITTLTEKLEMHQLAQEPADKWKIVRNTVLTALTSSLCGGILGAVFSIILAVK